VAKEIAEGMYDSDLTEAVDGTTTAENTSGGSAAGWSIPRAVASHPMGMGAGRGSSLKSSMNMNAFGSMPSSVSRSLRLR
jgi:hypothetical protein